MTVALYGIKNCDTVKQARAWLDAAGIAYAFHDYKLTPPSPEQLAAWCAAFGWEKVLNRAGTTFRKLHERQKQDLDEAKAMGLMLAQPSMIKRPILERGADRLIGFSPEAYRLLLASSLPE